MISNWSRCSCSACFNNANLITFTGQSQLLLTIIHP